jgi:uncharacterized protein DUF6178
MSPRALGVRRARQLITRLLDTPDLARVVQALEPRALHRLVRTCGLEDCGEIVALATTEQLLRVFDDDLWGSGAAGEEERFDAARFGLWLEVLADVDLALAARKLVEMDFDLVTAALTRHVLVLGPGSPGGRAAEEAGLDDSEADEAARAARVEQALEDGLACDFAGYRVVARRTRSWDALVALLAALDADHHAFFSRLMRRCHRISAESLEDGSLEAVLSDEEQVLADVAADRERRREEEGYVAPSDAAAFLELARRAPGGGADAVSGRDPVSAAWFRERDARAKRKAGSGGAKPSRAEPLPAEAPARDVASLVETLQEAGALPKFGPPLLLEGPGYGRSRLSLLRTQLVFVREHDPAVNSQRLEEIAYLANVLVAGCSLQSRRFRSVEAADAVLATCNLGLENWRPRQAALPPGFLLRQDLVAVFRVGWRVLHERVALHVARRLAETLAELSCDDDEVQADIAELRRQLVAEVAAGTPWRVRDRLDVLAVLDQPSWASLLALVDQCPVLPRAVEEPPGGNRRLRVPEDWDFISENAQIARARAFAQSLPDRLV